MSIFSRNKISSRSVKEAFDNLPAGLCFFNKNGMPKLCNRTMHRLVYSLTGQDLQHLSELEDKLYKSSSNDGIYRLDDGSSWRFISHRVKDSRGNMYTEYIAFDVTELCLKRTELEKDNEHLRNMSQQLRKLSSNIATVTRDEEVLALKMRVHDQMGRSLVATHKFLMQNKSIDKINPILVQWQSAVNLLQKACDEPKQADMLTELKKASLGMIEIITTGSLPEQEDAAYLIVTAIRECLTNAMRYGQATELYADIRTNGDYSEARITNNGLCPTGEIKEGGGLSTLRRRIERFGGAMTVRSMPEFELTVSIPVRKENLL